MSAQQLADRCEALGHAVPRAVISNLENGRRESITLAELLILARALRISPVSLVFPVGYEEQVELFPGFAYDTYDASGWWRSELEGPWGEADHLSGITLFDQHHDDLRKVTSLHRESEWQLERTAKLDPDADKDLREALIALSEAASREALQAGEALLNTREEIRLRGMTPPPLPEHLPGRETLLTLDEYQVANPGSRRSETPFNDDDWGAKE
jgi:transcriptional regulator with XRE-family HTH domain